MIGRVEEGHERHGQPRRELHQGVDGDAALAVLDLADPLRRGPYDIREPLLGETALAAQLRHSLPEVLDDEVLNRAAPGRR